MSWSLFVGLILFLTTREFAWLAIAIGVAVLFAVVATLFLRRPDLAASFLSVRGFLWVWGIAVICGLLAFLVAVLLAR
jgi:hypothetical protein